MYINKNKGSILFFAIVVISFVSWAIFTSSFLISNHREILHDKKSSSVFKHKEKILEAIFYKTIDDIEKQISEKGTKDIVWCLMEKDEALIWTNIYEEFVTTDFGCIITSLEINGEVLNFSESSSNFKYDNYITNGMLDNINNKVTINFYKKWENVFIEDDKNSSSYTVKLTGVISVTYSKIKGQEKVLSSYKLGGLRFEIY